MIKDRLLHIMRSKNLTASQFADLMQVQPSNISHLLSGRNKPSIDFLIKLKETFPEYSFDWIITGKKPITINNPTPGLLEDAGNDAENELKTDEKAVNQADNFGCFFVNNPEIFVIRVFHIAIYSFGCNRLSACSLCADSRFYFLADVPCVPL